MNKGFLSDSLIKPNEIETAKEAASKTKLPLLDLTCSNLTKYGYIFPSEILKRGVEAFLSNRFYDPDPKGLFSAREALVEYYRKYRDYNITADSVLITSSTSESYNLLFTLLADPGDNFLAPELSYPLFDLLAQASHVELKPYKMKRTKQWEIDYEDLCAQVDERTRGVLLISPHNPTGMVIEGANDLLNKLKLPLICDEVFCHFVDTKPAPVLGRLYGEIPVFCLNGISKMFALPDLKLAWIALNDNASKAYLNRLEILNDCYLSANSITQSMLPSILAQGMEFSNEMIKSIREKVFFVEEELRRIPFFEVVKSKGGAFVFASLDADYDEENLVIELIKEGAFVHPGYFYGANERAHIMISCVPSLEILREGLSIIKKHFR
ncbi:MAG: pyridoxal phosphate-dependent aminotransferase [SAR324 cluster bacterium]|uniref:Pyridoxal phosphate-dependent aminotransferase n=1 Tax=SAR324 cluster bacterium TaxID=2024889 RepID=A0A7X9FT20_9DELT|nr:pyridoxal phosphate-dependent aminotransferase [SAR324 cluster bacterium]